MPVLLDVAVGHVSPGCGVVNMMEGYGGECGLCDEEDVDGEGNECKEGEEGRPLS